MQHFLAGVIQMFRLELFLQLCLATVFGGAIGLERELGGKPAGLRTNILICLGSVIYTKLSVAMATGTADPTRIAAQIVTGVGFIGAGTILHARPEPTALDELETMVRRTGLEIERQASRRENVDLVIEFTLRGPKRLHDEVMIALLHHPGVRTVSTGE